MKGAIEHGSVFIALEALLILATERGYHKFSLSLNHKLAIETDSIIWLSRKRMVPSYTKSCKFPYIMVYESRSFNLLVMSVDGNDCCCTMSCSEAAAVGRECNPESVHSQTLLSKFIALITQ